MAKKQTLLQKLNAQRSRAGFEAHSKGSLDWFRKKVKSLSRENTFNTLVSDAKKKNQTLSRNPGVGFMYTFSYWAKHEEDLPYWDRFPLIFVVNGYDNGFLGINMHYLPPKARAVLFDSLQSIASNKAYNTRTKLQLSYGTLQKFKHFQPALKRYLFSQLRSPIAKIPSDEWEAALFLPTEKFVTTSSKYNKASKSQIWSDSMSGNTYKAMKARLKK